MLMHIFVYKLQYELTSKMANFKLLTWLQKNLYMQPLMQPIGRLNSSQQKPTSYTAAL